jgi:outer membrane protein OmpA-like peptidoglycan-associated protein
MRNSIIFLTCAGALLLAGTSGRAQTTVDPRALDQLNPPALAVPTRPPPPPTPAIVSAAAPGEVTKLADGVRLTFGEGHTDFNPATEEALRKLAHDLPPGDPVNVTAFAPGTPEDPSTPRRLALSRALAARSILITEGIASERIFVKALGAAAPITDGPPDRVDVTTAVTNSQARSGQ